MNPPAPLLDPTGIARLREALRLATTSDTTLPPAAGASPVPRDLATVLAAAEGRLATLVQLFLLGWTVPEEPVVTALDPLPLATALESGLLERHDDGLRGRIALTPYDTLDGTRTWLLADLPARHRPVPPDFVLGINNTATTLTRATVRSPVTTALDLGTGAGVQALELSRHAASVTATDLNERALRFAATTAALNELEWELLAGDMLTPVAGRRFDLVVSNLPFVIGPGTVHTRYRDSGRPGDSIIPELVTAAPSLLTEGGHLQFLANWTHLAGTPWPERLAGWLDGTGLDAWILQRELVAPDAYVTLWLRDAGQETDGEYARRWRTWFAEAGVEAVGMGIVTLRRSDTRDPVVRIEEIPQQFSVPLGAEIPDWFRRVDWLRERPGAALLDERYVTADSLRMQTESVRGEDTWETTQQVLGLTEGLRWRHPVQPVVPALLAGCTGRHTLGELVARLADQHDLDLAALRQAATALVTPLVEHALILPVDRDGRD